MHAVGPRQEVRILTVQVAVYANAEEGMVADEISALLSECGIAAPDSPILDWRYAMPPVNVVASDDPQEGEVFEQVPLITIDEDGYPYFLQEMGVGGSVLWVLHSGVWDAYCPDSYQPVYRSSGAGIPTSDELDEVKSLYADWFASKYVLVEFDRAYTGGDYNGVGQQVYVPYDARVEERMSPTEAEQVLFESFTRVTGLPPVHIVYWRELSPEELEL